MLKSFLSIILSFFLIAGVSAAKPPVAELEFRTKDLVIRIADKQCDNKDVLEQLKPEFHDKFRKAEVRYSGKSINGCWTVDEQNVFIILENGEQGYVPAEAFKPVEVI